MGNAAQHLIACVAAAKRHPGTDLAAMFLRDARSTAAQLLSI